MRYYNEMENCPDEALDGEDGFYFWLNTDFLFGDYSEPKWAFHCARSDGHGWKKEETDKIILWGLYQDLSAYDPERDESDQNWDDLGNEIDQIIESELGYCPNYDVN